VGTHVRGDDLGVVEVGGSRGGGGELGGELTEAEVLALALDVAASQNVVVPPLPSTTS
jgi:hypothetical protein